MSQKKPFAKTPKVIDDIVQYFIHLKKTLHLINDNILPG